MCVQKGLAAFGWADRVAHRRRFVERLEERVKAGDTGAEVARDGQGLQSTLRRGWYWGSQQFREALLERAKQSGVPLRSNPNYRGSALGKDWGRAEAEKWLARGLEHFSLANIGDGASKERRDHDERVLIAWALATRTEINQRWIADKLGLKSAGNVSQQVRRFRQRMQSDLRSFATRKMEWIKTVKSH